MGYLSSCKSESSISISTSNPTKTHQNPDPEKPTIKIQEFNYKDLELATNNFSRSKLLGRGSHGLVYKGVLRNGRLVAVKKPSRTTPKFPSPQNPNPNPNEVENEIEILSTLQSPRLVNLVGFTNNAAHDRLLVVEFMSNGTLFDVLHSNKNTRPPSWGRRVKLALQVAKAIDTLHCLNPPVIHRDIKSANVLIDRSFNARLGDFGLALRCVDDFRLRCTPPAGTMGYLDPGYVTPDNLSTKTDVFSFGILLFEIISGRKAIDMGHSPPSIIDWAVPLIRRGKLLGVYDPRIMPPKDGLVRKMLAVVAAKCVRSCRERRPSMKEVVECLSEVSKLVPVHSWNGLGNPCLMVENVGRPVQSRSALVKSKGVSGGKGNGEDGEGNVGKSVISTRRVYSDLGFRNNLMDLMAGDDGLEVKLEPDKKLSSLRFEKGRSNFRDMVLGDRTYRGSKLKRNQSVGEISETFSVKDDKVGSKEM